MFPSYLVLSHDIQQRLFTISKNQFPQESCAIIFGIINYNDEVIYEAIQVINVENFAHSPVEFKIDELELYTAIKLGEESGLRLLGIYHSHPDDAYLSSYDRKTIKNISILYPDWIWVVYGNQSQTLKAFFVKNKTQFTEIPIKKCI